LSKINVNYPRLAIVLITVIGLLLPWVRIVSNEAPAIDKLLPGWALIIGSFVGAVNDIPIYGLDLVYFISLLYGVCALAIILNLFFNILQIKRGMKSNRNKTFSLINIFSIGFVIIIFSSVLFLTLPFIGYWLTISGLLSGAIFEWTNIKKTNDNLVSKFD
jgi:hypothetical protein